MLASCDSLYSIYFVNRYDKNVYVEYYVSNYPDTTLLGTGCVYNPATQSQDTAHIYEKIGRCLISFIMAAQELTRFHFLFLIPTLLIIIHGIQL